MKNHSWCKTYLSEDNPSRRPFRKHKSAGNQDFTEAAESQMHRRAKDKAFQALKLSFLVNMGKRKGFKRVLQPENLNLISSLEQYWVSPVLDSPRDLNKLDKQGKCVRVELLCKDKVHRYSQVKEEKVGRSWVNNTKWLKAEWDMKGSKGSGVKEYQDPCFNRVLCQVLLLKATNLQAHRLLEPS